MVRSDIHFFSADALPLVLQFLQDRGIKIDSHKSVSFTDTPKVVRLCPDNCVTLKVKYHV